MEVNVTDRNWLKEQLPKMNQAEMLGLWFESLPDPRRDSAGDDVDARLFACGMIATEMRSRALGNRNLELLGRVHIMAHEMEQVARHIKFKQAQNDPGLRAQSRGIILPPGYNE